MFFNDAYGKLIISDRAIDSVFSIYNISSIVKIIDDPWWLSWRFGSAYVLLVAVILVLQLLVVEKSSAKLSYASFTEDNSSSNQDESSKLHIKVLPIPAWTTGNCKPALKSSFLFDTTTLFSLLLSTTILLILHKYKSTSEKGFDKNYFYFSTVKTSLVRGMYSTTFWSGKHKIYSSKWHKYWSISECFFLAVFCTSSAVNIFSTLTGILLPLFIFTIPLSLDLMSSTLMITSDRKFRGVRGSSGVKSNYRF